MTVPGSVISWTNAHIHARSRVFVFIHLEYQALNEVLVSKCNDLYYAAFVLFFFLLKNIQDGSTVQQWKDIYIPTP